MPAWVEKRREASEGVFYQAKSFSLIKKDSILDYVYKKSLNYVLKKKMLNYHGSLYGNFSIFLRAPKVCSIKIYIPLTNHLNYACGTKRKQTGDNENRVSRKHPERTTIMRREVQKALRKTRGTSKEIERPGEELSSPSQKRRPGNKNGSEGRIRRRAERQVRQHVIETEGNGMYGKPNIIYIHVYTRFRPEHTETTIASERQARRPEQRKKSKEKHRRP